jgi:hypothetical protein
LTFASGASDNSAMTAHLPRLPFTLDPLMAEAKRRMRKRRLLVAVLAVLAVGGAASAGVILISSSPVQSVSGACGAWTGYYAYAVPQDLRHPAAAGSGATSWGWIPRKHALKVGERFRLGPHGRLWQVNGITAMPGVESVCRPFGINGWPLPGQHVSGNTSMVLGGRLVLQPVG